MGNFRHYVKSISSGDDFFTLERKLNFLVAGLAIYHFILAAIFFIVDVIPLMIYNVLSVLFYSLVITALHKKKAYASSTVLMMCEVILCSYISTLFTGWDTGFAMYDIVLITACFYMTFVIESFQKKEFIPFMFSVLVILCYVFNYITSIFYEPMFPIASIFGIRFLYILNSVVCLGVMVVFCFLLVWELRLSNNRLTSQNEVLNDLAHKDPLTRLYNRRSMNKFLDESLANLKLKGKRFSLVLGDIDDFKHVNDTYGHDAGDIVLKTVAGIISEGVNEGDYVCRWGGEEILILINSPIETASIMAERIRKRLEDTCITYDGQEIRVTMTLGLSESIPGYRIEHLIQQADDKLYAGKKSGKNKVVI